MKSVFPDIHFKNYYNKVQGVNLHIVFWLLFIIYEVSLAGTIMNKMPHFLDLILHYPLYIGIFYYHCFVVLDSNISDQEKNWKGMLIHLISELSVFFILGALISYYLFSLHITAKWNINNEGFIFGNIYRGVYMLSLSTAYWFTLYNSRKQNRIHQMEQENLIALMEKEKLKIHAEAALLRATINPHMLFNTLNFLYNEVRKIDKPVAEHILSLSELMRYSLSGSTKGETVMLEDELSYIEHYIHLYKQRIPSAITIVKTGACQDYQQKIIPLLLVTLIENMFQHGDLDDAADAALIEISSQKGFLKIVTRNKVKAQPSAGHGMGLENMKKRLQYSYPGAFEYSALLEEKIYKSRLELNLN